MGVEGDFSRPFKTFEAFETLRPVQIFFLALKFEQICQNESPKTFK